MGGPGPGGMPSRRVMIVASLLTVVSPGGVPGLVGVLLFVASHAVSQVEAKIILGGPSVQVICASSGIADTLVSGVRGSRDMDGRSRTALAGLAISLPRTVSIRRPKATAFRVLMDRG